MATIRKEIVIEANADQVWGAVSDIGAVHQRFVPGYTLDTRLDGNDRILYFPHGGVVRERIVSIDAKTYRFSYAVVEGSNPPLIHHHASFQVFAKDENESILVWITDFLPNHTEPEMRIRIDRASQIIKQTIEKEVK
ncbi:MULTISPECIES: SRPBCC family protein [Bacillus]|uniref:SRPBCC family protein n=1 Tax=Bacillus TaxID=1386 RepID=UPI00046B0438|nr:MULTISPECIES: SRPBCC family protein [Bacillus]MED1412479.1 SRPBCC family protein [Bacillus paramycoides]MED1464228.1 SRPBCC family protein [Bacillus paramycoides]MED1495232.1 SRPBCC family protein [Bacillus paramycoides]